MGNTISAEVLAPAGDFNTFKAVINAGADAVYCGGSMFGARAYADNFSTKELLCAIDYAHMFGRKVYLTVNTLLKNEELEKKLYDYLKPFYEAGLDAVIVQDYGVMDFISRIFPDMPVHASTQMTITHRFYCDFLAKYNVTRIVPARELSLSEIAAIREYAPGMELECFVHGALCYCYSGMCMMSSFYGGRSGNRGRCAGTCRLMYDAGGTRRPILSLKDLCTLESLPDILDAGVMSLKIEGRMKSAEYAAGVTSIYRKYVDMYLSGRDNYSVDPADIKRLLMLFDRGGMTDGYYFRHNSPDMIADENKSAKSLDEKSEYEKMIHDRYVISDIRHNISLTGEFCLNSPASLSVEGKWGKVTAKGDAPDESINRPMSAKDISKQLVKTGNTVFNVTDCLIKSDDGIFIPNKALNELRRQAIEEYGKLCPDRVRRSALECTIRPAKADLTVESQRVQRTAKVSDTGQALSCIACGVDRLYLESESMTEDEMLAILDRCREQSIQCFYSMPRVLRDDIAVLKGFDGYLVRNIAEKYYLIKQGITEPIVFDYTVYAFNNQAAAVLSDEGYERIFYPIELNYKELSNLILSQGELTVYGRLPLMVSANCIDNSLHRCHHGGIHRASFTDRKNQRLMYMACCRYCYNVIYNGMIYDIRDKISSMDRIRAAALNYSFTFETADEVRKILTSDEVDLVAVTRGHFKNGVE